MGGPGGPQRVRAFGILGQGPDGLQQGVGVLRRYEHPRARTFHFLGRSALCRDGREDGPPAWKYEVSLDGTLMSITAACCVTASTSAAARISGNSPSAAGG